MKVAVSIPDRVFKSADDLAKRLKISRSELYAGALEAYLATRGADAIRERLDAVYEVERGSVDAALDAAQLKVLDDEAW